MNTMSDFYDNLDLKYPEIAIAMQDIDRTYPGKVKFIIPILTPNMSTTKLEEKTIYQTGSNLQNAGTKPEVTNIKCTNYVEIELPKELCAYVGGTFEILEAYEWLPEGTPAKDSILHVRDADVTIDPARQIGSGTVIEGGSFNVTGSVTGIMRFTDGIPTGFLNLMPVDRYIKEGSKWIVVFLGGDITKPYIVARYPQEQTEEETTTT